eukprot:SAG31_NODE_453_length_15464_cov_37.074064_1_plen_222_part_00
MILTGCPSGLDGFTSTVRCAGPARGTALSIRNAATPRGNLIAEVAMLRHRLLPLLLAAAACHGLPAERPKPPRPSGPGRRCPHRNVTSQVINGRPIVEGSFPFPWLSWLGDSVSGQFCGGTLIAPGWVLTAAHCLWEELPLPPDPYAVDVQLHRRDYSLPIEEEAPAISVYAVEQHIHPDYDASSLFNDIALLRLNSTVPNDVATPVRLDTGIPITPNYSQ